MVEKVQIRRQRHRAGSYKRFEKALSAAMAIENIHLCLQRRWAITWEAKPSYFNPLTVVPPN